MSLSVPDLQCLEYHIAWQVYLILGVRVLNKIDRCDLQELQVKVTVKFTLEQATKVQKGVKV